MKLLSIILISVLILTGCNKNQDVFNLSLDNAITKTKSTIEQIGDTTLLPRNITKGESSWNLVNIHDWTSGFWPGQLWYAYEATGDSSILKHAIKATEKLEDILDVPVDNHDLGFMLFCSYGNGYRLTQNETYKEVLIRAADSLATLYNPTVGTILSWPAMVEKMGWPHNTIIDNMINLELLFWAAKNGGSHNLYDIAVRHAEVTMKNHIRPDFTTYHVAVYDTIDGHFMKGVTHQGYSDSSMWARGQAWGIYGFTMCYRETGKIEFLKTAINLANTYIERLPEDKIPYWDFDDPSIPNAPKDASAAAVVSSGLLELSGLVKDVVLAKKYKQLAIEILKVLSSDKYLAPDGCPALLNHSTGHYPNNSEIDIPIIYADYYYLEALLRLKKQYQ